MIAYFERGKLVTDWWIEHLFCGPVRRRWVRTASGWDYEDEEIDPAASGWDFDQARPS